MGEPSKDSTHCSQDSPPSLEFNCCGTQLMWPERWYLTNQNDGADHSSCEAIMWTTARQIAEINTWK